MIRLKLQTDRLTLDPINSNDLEIFHKTNTDPFVRKYLWDGQKIPYSLSAKIIEEVERRFKQEQWGLWKIINSTSEDYLGYAGFWYFFDEKQPQLLYALLPEFTGNGYATEASRELIKYAFEVLNFDYLMASTDKSNKESVNVAQRLNMELAEEKEIEGKSTLFFRLETVDPGYNNRTGRQW